MGNLRVKIVHFVAFCSVVMHTQLFTVYYQRTRQCQRRDQKSSHDNVISAVVDF